MQNDATRNANADVVAVARLSVVQPLSHPSETNFHLDDFTVSLPNDRNNPEIIRKNEEILDVPRRSL